MSRHASETPTVYVIAGPNGAGKTTFAMEFLPRIMDCPEFLNADLIAKGLAPLAPESQNIRAGRLLLERFDELTRNRSDFGFETTLSGRTYVRRFRRLRNAGYRIVAFFLWLPSVKLAIARVANRVKQGGHHVPESDIRRRFAAGLRNFHDDYAALFDAWWLYDGSQIPPQLIAHASDGKIEVDKTEVYERAKQSLDG